MTAHLDIDDILAEIGTLTSRYHLESAVRRASTRHKPHLAVETRMGTVELRPTVGRWDHVAEDLQRGQHQTADNPLGVVRPVSSQKPELLVTMTLSQLLWLLSRRVVIS